MLGAISARKSAPNDGAGQVPGRPVGAYSHSKQNSDTKGFHYQWGRKDPFTFATSSINGGKYPVKIYNKKYELIYQMDSGGDNTDKTPIGGLIISKTTANSMIETIKGPSIFSSNGGIVVSQTGHIKELFNYYWTSYSRGTDGSDNPKNEFFHNTYLDGYIVLRPKSIYDPCPYGYRTPTIGTYNEYKTNTGWIHTSYIGGTVWKSIWIPALGTRNSVDGLINNVGWAAYYFFATRNSENSAQVMYFNASGGILVYGINTHTHSVRCIEDVASFLPQWCTQ